MSKEISLAPKPRFEILDGLRGVAAILVLSYHHFEVFSHSNPMMPWINHGYLAVDFFFILSGFVIGYAYDDRWPKGMTVGQFFKRRLIRLHPMIIFATVMCMCTFYFGAGDVFPLIAQTSPWKLLLFGLLSILMFPVPMSWDIRGWSEINPINGNAWTLYFEYFANILYALVIRKFPKWLLAVFVALSSVLILDLTLNLNMFGFLSEGHATHAYTVIGGWSVNVGQVYIGMARLLYPFFGGLLLSRMGKRISVGRNGFWWAAAAIVVLLCMPRIGGADHGIWNGIYEAVCILLLFPVVVLMGAGSQVSGVSAKVCKWLGNISYPLYVTHYGIVFGMVEPWFALHPDVSSAQKVAISLGSMLLSIFIAHAALRLYDEPVRRWLSQKSTSVASWKLF